MINDPYWQTTISWNLTVGFCFYCLELSSNGKFLLKLTFLWTSARIDPKVLHTAPAVAGAGVATAAHGMRWQWELAGGRFCVGFYFSNGGARLSFYIFRLQRRRCKGISDWLQSYLGMVPFLENGIAASRMPLLTSSLEGDLPKFSRSLSRTRVIRPGLLDCI